MITNETIEKIAQNYQMGVFPNIVREYFQNIFLEQLYKFPGADKLLFRGGTALRIVYGSPRFSEDLDFSLFGVARYEVKQTVEDLFVSVLKEIEQVGIKVELGGKSDRTTGGYFGVATFNMNDYRPIGIEINISTRSDVIMRGEVDSVANDFIPTYNIIHLPKQALVEEKIFGALLERKKARDFYDLYWMMRKGMLSIEQKGRLSGHKSKILENAENVDFRGELGVFLPADQQGIIRDFIRTLAGEMDRQLSYL